MAKRNVYRAKLKGKSTMLIMAESGRTNETRTLWIVGTFANWFDMLDHIQSVDMGIWIKRRIASGKAEQVPNCALSDGRYDTLNEILPQ